MQLWVSHGVLLISSKHRRTPVSTLCMTVILKLQKPGTGIAEPGATRSASHEWNAGLRIGPTIHLHAPSGTVFTDSGPRLWRRLSPGVSYRHEHTVKGVG